MEGNDELPFTVGSFQFLFVIIQYTVYFDFCRPMLSPSNLINQKLCRYFKIH